MTATPITADLDRGALAVWAREAHVRECWVCRVRCHRTTANDEMRTAKQAALDTYLAVCPATDHRCSEAHHTAHRALVRAFADADAGYSDVLRGLN